MPEIVDFPKQPEAYGGLGAHVARAVLLAGAPGTGEMLLARAVAGAAGVPFYSTSRSELVEMFVGVGAARVRDLFEAACRSAPCNIFIDVSTRAARQVFGISEASYWSGARPGAKAASLTPREERRRDAGAAAEALGEFGHRPYGRNGPNPE